jgi:hypothetical protein
MKNNNDINQNIEETNKVINKDSKDNTDNQDYNNEENNNKERETEKETDTEKKKKMETETEMDKEKEKEHGEENEKEISTKEQIEHIEQNKIQIQNKIQENIDIKEQEKKEKHKNRLFLLKYILNLDLINNLKSLKNEIKEYFGKYEMKIFEDNWTSMDLSGIGQQEQNNKFNEFLKFGIFNDIYENILSKHLSDFYKSVILDKNFCESLEKILVHYFNVNNNLIDNDSKIVDFNDVIKNFTIK